MPPRTPPRPRVARKLLVASVGVATMAYVGASCGGTTEGPSGGADAATADHVDDFPVANLVAPPTDAHDDTSAADALDDFPVANLVAPPDAGLE